MTVEKEDGQSEDVLCQLKSTDAQSIKVNKYDLDTLQYNAMVAHKLPVFAIQFIQSNEVYLLVKPDMLTEVAQYIETGERTAKEDFVGVNISEHEDVKPIEGKVIKSSSSARERFEEEWSKKFKKGKRSAT